VKTLTKLSFKHELTFAPRRTRPGRWLILAALVPVLAGAYAYAFMRPEPRAPEPALSPTTETRPPAAAALSSRSHVVVRRNDTIEGIFRQLNVSAADLKTVLAMPGVGVTFKQIQPGDKITVVHDGAMLYAVNRHISETEVVAVTRGAGGFAAERIITLN